MPIELGLQSKIKHGALLRLSMKLGSQSALARKLELHTSQVGRWINLKDYPNTAWVEKYPLKASLLERLTGQTIDELWPEELKLQIEAKLETRVTIFKEFENEALVEYVNDRARRLTFAQQDKTFSGLSVDTDMLQELLAELSEEEREMVELKLKAKPYYKIGKLFNMRSWKAKTIIRKALRKMERKAHENGWTFETITGIE